MRQGPCDFFDILCGEALRRVEFVAGNPHAERCITDCGTHRRQRFLDESKAPVERSSPCVIAEIEPGIEKLRRQVAVAGDQFHTVKTRLGKISGSLGESLDHLLDEGTGHGPRHDVKALVGNRGRSNGGGHETIGANLDFPARMKQLAEEPRAVPLRRSG